MSTRLVPADVRMAARRGFLRTAAQSLASVIPITGIAVALSGAWLLAVGLGVAGALLTALCAGAQSYLSILSKGIPADYLATPAITGADLTYDEVQIIRELRLGEGRELLPEIPRG